MHRRGPQAAHGTQVRCSRVFHCAALTERCSKREYLLAQIRQKDRTIQFLLKQIQNAQGPAANAASPPSSSTFNPSISESGADDGRSEAILNWLNRAGRSPSAGLEGDTIELSITDVDQANTSLPPEVAPLGTLANLAIRDAPSRPSSVGDPEENSEGEIGVARSDYFLNRTSTILAP